MTFQMWDLMMAIRIGGDSPSYSLFDSFLSHGTDRDQITEPS